ncbi:MAG: hypothetical protein H6741_21425 [Alphaproteobacteria bacterium]|nr:hypothetical protein [Alphaproteobacteria bacterium]
MLLHLLHRHPELVAEAEALAEDVAGEVDREAVAESLLDALSDLTLEDLSARAGRQRRGYVDPGEAANDMAEACVQEHLDDILRLAGAGLEDAARAVCEGVFLALHRVDAEAHEVLMHAPEVPEELAAYVADRWRAAEGPKKGRRRPDPELLAGELRDWGRVVAAREG